MKKIFFILSILFLLPVQSLAAERDLASELSGRILLQVESFGRAWYIDPVSEERYYLQDGATAYEIMRELGLGITNKDLAKIPTKEGQYADAKLVSRLSGRILLQVENNGEAWYVNPVDGLRYYMENGEAAYTLMREKSLGISNEDLATIPVTPNQIIQDTTFNDVAHVYYDGENFSDEYHADEILSLASLSKLMTAIVFYETNPDWNKKVTITQGQIDYPRTLVGNAATSEVSMKAGDTMSVYDLWAAMLIASSNQSAVALSENAGMTRQQFIDKMNEKAIELGLEKTKFYDPSGLDSHNVTTPKEMAKLAYYAFSIPRIAEVSKFAGYTITAASVDGPREINVIDRNYSLKQFSPDGVKTGYLTEAQRCVALMKDGGIVVVMHALSMDQRNSTISKILAKH